MAGFNDWIEIFKGGLQEDNKGRSKYYSDKDLDLIVSTYNPSYHEAPLVFGHPVDDKPALGWVESLKRQGDVVLAKFKQVPPEVSEWVKSGFYKKRSISLRPDGSLKHVGLLGAVPPAIKGLSDIKFREEENDLIYYFNENGDDDKEMDPKDEKIQNLEKTIADFMEQQKEKDREIAEFKSKDEEILTLKANLVKFQKEARQKEHSDFCEKELSDKLLPAYKKDVMDFCEILHEVGTYNFSEGGEKSALDKFKDLLKNNLKEHKLFSEVATKERAVEKSGGKTSRYSRIANEKGLDVNEEQSELHQKILNYMEKNPDVSYEIAVEKVRSK